MKVALAEAARTPRTMSPSNSPRRMAQRGTWNPDLRAGTCLECLALLRRLRAGGAGGALTGRMGGGLIGGGGALMGSPGDE